MHNSRSFKLEYVTANVEKQPDFLITPRTSFRNMIFDTFGKDQSQSRRSITQPRTPKITMNLPLASVPSRAYMRSRLPTNDMNYTMYMGSTTLYTHVHIPIFIPTRSIPIPYTYLDIRIIHIDDQLWMPHIMIR